MSPADNDDVIHSWCRWFRKIYALVLHVICTKVILIQLEHEQCNLEPQSSGWKCWCFMSNHKLNPKPIKESNNIKLCTFHEICFNLSAVRFQDGIQMFWLCFHSVSEYLQTCVHNYDAKIDFLSYSHSVCMFFLKDNVKMWKPLDFHSHNHPSGTCEKCKWTPVQCYVCIHPAFLFFV